LRQLPENEHNAPLHLFSAAPELVKYGSNHYHQHSDHTSTLIRCLFVSYAQEGVTMPYTLEDFARDYAKEHLKELTPQERLEGMSPEERLEGMSAEEVLQMRKAIEDHLRKLKNGMPPPQKPEEEQRQ